MTEGASPQLEDGFTRIANELLEALAGLRCPPVVVSLMLAVIRETYGYNRKTSPVSRERLATIMGVSYDRVRQAARVAEDWNVVVREGRQIGIQKDYSKWHKPEGGASENREGGLPVNARVRLGLEEPEAPSSENREGGLPGDDLAREDTNRKGGLPVKPEGGHSSLKERKERGDDNVPPSFPPGPLSPSLGAAGPAPAERADDHGSNGKQRGQAMRDLRTCLGLKKGDALPSEWGMLRDRWIADCHSAGDLFEQKLKSILSEEAAATLARHRVTAKPRLAEHIQKELNRRLGR